MTKVSSNVPKAAVPGTEMAATTNSNNYDLALLVYCVAARCGFDRSMTTLATAVALTLARGDAPEVLKGAHRIVRRADVERVALSRIDFALQAAEFSACGRVPLRSTMRDLLVLRSPLRLCTMFGAKDRPSGCR